MWTTHNRKRYDRSRLRYPSDLTRRMGACRTIDPAGQAWRRQAHRGCAGSDERDHVHLEHGLPMACASQGPAAEEHGALDLWSYDGTLDRIHHALYAACREQSEREASPTAAIIDSQSVKSAEKGGPESIRMAMMRARRSRARSVTFS